MKKYKPTSAGRRGMTVVSYKDHLTTTKNAHISDLQKESEVLEDETVKDALLPTIVALVTSEPTVMLTSSTTRKIFLRRLSQ